MIYNLRLFESMELKEDQSLITDQKQLIKLYLDLQSRCIKIDNYEDAGMSVEAIIEKMMVVLKSVKELQLFSPNQNVKEVHTEQLKLLVLPYWIGWLYSRIQEPRLKAVQAEKDYLSSFLHLMDQFSCEDEEIFPKNLKNMWQAQAQEPSFRPQRSDLIQAMKQKKIAEQRYSNWQKIKDEGDKRQALKDFITIQIHNSIAMMRAIQEEFNILKYKDTLQKDEKAKQLHEQEMNKPIPKMKVWQIPPKDEIQQYMCPQKSRKEVIAQVWQENANKPTMTLTEIGDLQIQNAQNRSIRQAAQKQANYVDTDSDKEQNDDRMKKEARYMDDWKESHQKGAGNQNKR